jgi:D-alanine transfer protein
MRLAAGRRHSTVAAVAAVCAAVLLLSEVDRQARIAIAENAAALAPLNLSAAARGVALQQQVLRQPGFLPIYGSSELTIDQPTRPALFFQTHQCGFAVFPIGSAGDRCLIILQELAAMADVIRGRRVAIFLSPQWFTPPGWRQDHTAHRQFAGRFSPLEAGVTVLGRALSPGLKRDIAGRLLAYRSVWRVRSPLLAFACTQLRAQTWTGKIALWLLAPLDAAADTARRFQDRWQTLEMIRGRQVAAYNPPPGAIGPALSPAPVPDADAAFLRRMNGSPEWIDFALLLRTIRELGAEALLLGQPINGRLSERSGVSARTRQIYYERVRRLAAENGVALQDFSAHEDEPAFFADPVHPSAQAWLYYDQALDEFYHRPQG